MTPLDDAVVLVRAVRGLYDGDAAALGVLDELDRRLHEPLRVAIAGIVKAGKSTLLNALLGERIAPTDAGECTRVVTWYRYADTPSITLHPREGQPRRLPVRRVHGQLALDLAGLPPEDIDRIDIGWPSRVLRSVILIDTPGIASLSRAVSARSAAFLAPDDAPSSADAIVYLLRHLHPSDVRFLEAFRDTAAGASRTVNAVAVLSRADEIGSGRIDSLLSAGKVALRYERDGGLASLALGVIPVAGLLAEGARTLREAEFAAFRELAALDRADREGLLTSADRFVRPSDVVTLGEQERRELLARFGIYGVRLATSLVRAGATDSSELADLLVQHSGLQDLSRFIQRQFESRATTLKVRGVLDTLERLLRGTPRDGSTPILAGIERIQATAHSLRELSVLSQARVTGLPLPAAEAADAVRIIGGDGTAPAARLALSVGADDAEVRARVALELDRWRATSQSPLTERAAREVCRVVIRSLEEVASEVGGAGGDGPAADVVLAGGPGDGGGEGAHHQGEQHQSGLGGEDLTQQHASVPATHQL